MGRRKMDKSVSNEAITKLHCEGNTATEIAKKLGITYDTVRGRLYRLNLAVKYQRYKQPRKLYDLPKLSTCEGGISILGEDIDKILNLKEGMKVKVKSDDRITTRKISKIFKHHVLTIHPLGFKECFTKGELLMYNYGKRGIEG